MEVSGRLPARRLREARNPLAVPYQRVDCNPAAVPPSLLAANRVVGKARVLVERPLPVALHRLADLAQLAEPGARGVVFQQEDHAQRVGALQPVVRPLPVEPSQRADLARQVELLQPVARSQRAVLPQRAEPLHRVALPPRVELLQPVARLRLEVLPQRVELVVVREAIVDCRHAARWAPVRADGIRVRMHLYPRTCRSPSSSGT